MLMKTCPKCKRKGYSMNKENLKQCDCGNSLEKVPAKPAK